VAYADLRNVRASVDVEQEVIRNEECRMLLTVLKSLTEEERKLLGKIANQDARNLNLSSEEKRILSKIRLRIRGYYP